MYSPMEQAFLNPDREYSPIPFWFWNDQLNEKELKRQISDFDEKGVNGFVLHPRMGIPKNTPYLSRSFMNYVKYAVEEASKLNMKVILYDEGMYPSGSANGEVVKENPAFASRGLYMKKIPAKVFHMNKLTLLLEEDEKLVALYFAKKQNEREVDLDTATCIYPLSVPIVSVSKNKNKNLLKLDESSWEEYFKQRVDIESWYVIACVETYTMGTIRGIHIGQDDGEKGAPRSADLLNPQAVESFIRHTHEKYKAAVGKYFGSTIIAMFTDEPDIVGRNARADVIPWTSGLLDEFLAYDHQLKDLLALFIEDDIEVNEVKARYEKMIKDRMKRVYYQTLSEWCEENNLALTGHPADSDDIGLLDSFHIPGQDVVWRWVAPENNRGIEGEHSTAAKCGSDAARHRGRKKNLNEVLGVCGIDNNWNLTADDMKWYIDWLAVRGVNLYSPHAFYYSVDGEIRSHERPPDVGPNNTWWPYYTYFSTYMKRLSWLMTDSVNQAHVAIYAKSDHLTWRGAKILFQNQVEFNYLEADLIDSDQVNINGCTLEIVNQAYYLLVLEDVRLREISQKGKQKLLTWVKNGGQLLSDDQEIVDYFKGVYFSNDSLIDNINRASEVKSNQTIPIIQLNKYAPDIRISTIKKDDSYFHFIVNEGEEAFSEKISLVNHGEVSKWDPWSGDISGFLNEELSTIEKDGKVIQEIPLHLERRSSIILKVNSNNSKHISTLPAKKESIQWQNFKEINGPWTVRCQNKIIFEELAVLSDWVSWNEFIGYSGSMEYESTFCLTEVPTSQRVMIDLGECEELAEVYLNEVLVGVKMWSPYQLIFNKRMLNEKENILRIIVTNNAANKMDKLRKKSGLFGPVMLKEEVI